MTFDNAMLNTVIQRNPEQENSAKNLAIRNSSPNKHQANSEYSHVQEQENSKYNRSAQNDIEPQDQSTSISNNKYQEKENLDIQNRLSPNLRQSSLNILPFLAQAESQSSDLDSSELSLEPISLNINSNQETNSRLLVASSNNIINNDNLAPILTRDLSTSPIIPPASIAAVNYDASNYNTPAAQGPEITALTKQDSNVALSSEKQVFIPSQKIPTSDLAEALTRFGSFIPNLMDKKKEQENSLGDLLRTIETGIDVEFTPEIAIKNDNVLDNNVIANESEIIPDSQVTLSSSNSQNFDNNSSNPTFEESAVSDLVKPAKLQNPVNSNEPDVTQQSLDSKSDSVKTAQGNNFSSLEKFENNNSSVELTETFLTERVELTRSSSEFTPNLSKSVGELSEAAKFIAKDAFEPALDKATKDLGLARIDNPEFVKSFNSMANGKFKIEQTLDRTENHVTVKLHPEKFGTLDFRLEIPNTGNAKLIITADNREALAVLKEHIQELEVQLKNIGINTGSTPEFNLREGDKNPDNREAYKQAFTYKEEEYEDKANITSINRYQNNMMQGNIDTYLLVDNYKPVNIYS